MHHISLGLQPNLKEGPLDVETSTLPLNKGDILHHVKLVSEVYKLHPRLMTLVYKSWEMSFSQLK